MAEPIKLNHLFYKSLGFTCTLAGAEEWLDDNPKAREVIDANIRNFTDQTVKYFRKSFSTQIMAYNAKYKLEAKERKKERDEAKVAQKNLEAEAMAKSREENMRAEIESEMRARLEKEYEQKFKLNLLTDRERRNLAKHRRELEEDLEKLIQKIAKLQAKKESMESELVELEKKGITSTQSQSIDSDDEDSVLV